MLKYVLHRVSPADYRKHSPGLSGNVIPQLRRISPHNVR